MSQFSVSLLFFLALSGCSNNEVHVSIFNNSGQEITELHVELSGKRQSLKGIPENSKAVIVFKNVSDSHYVLKGELKDGTVLEGDYGYVTNGVDFRDRFMINEGGAIDFKSGI